MLDSNVQFLKGVGPSKAKLLAKLGICTVRDLLYHFPREYDDRRTTSRIADFAPAERMTISGKVAASDVVKLTQNMAVFKAAIDDGTGIAYAVFFRKFNPYHKHDIFSSLKKVFEVGARLIVNGKASLNFGEKQIQVEEYEVETQDSKNYINFKRIVPIYPLTLGISGKWIRTMVKLALEIHSADAEELLPDEFRANLGLMPIGRALNMIHFPAEPGDSDNARSRIAFDEFLLIETALFIARSRNSKITKNRTYTLKRNLLTPFRNKLNFEFTNAQKKCINEIFSDILNPSPMNRLLMGDVGSGKTVVALCAMLLAIENGFQALFIAPTEILAEQHFITISRMLQGINVRIAILTGRDSSKKKKKSSLLEKTAKGEIDLLIATHAALESNVKFKNLALAVIDEQHKFGVIQKGQIQKKAKNPDILLMTATPIPRTLSLTVYGDMDISVIDELPKGRQPIVTLHSNEMEGYNLVKNEINSGRQAYIVYPLVEESDKVELKAAVQEAETLSATVFKEFKVGLIHGQLPADIKDSIMQSFRDRQFDILIATTVIEVGIDVPNASVMVIEHSDRFGLATMHQLRGRVGRGANKSYCVLLGTPKTDEARLRIETMLKYLSGFKVAEADLDLRGPGEFFGTAQHGLLVLKAGNIVKDIKIIEQAKLTASEITSADPDLKTPAFAKLKSAIIMQYSNRLDLLKIG